MFRVVGTGLVKTVAVPAEEVTLPATTGIAHKGLGNVAKGAATNAERINLLHTNLMVGVFFIGGMIRT
jgi:hypothetical protein